MKLIDQVNARRTYYHVQVIAIVTIVAVRPPVFEYTSVWTAFYMSRMYQLKVDC